MHANRSVKLHQQKRVHIHASNSDSYDFFIVLTSPELLDQVETVLPDHRERLFPPTETLSMFLAQALSADRSCQQAVNDAIRTKTPMTLSFGITLHAVRFTLNQSE